MPVLQPAPQSPMLQRGETSSEILYKRGQPLTSLGVTPLKIGMSPKKGPFQKENSLLPSNFFRGHGSFQGSTALSASMKLPAEKLPRHDLLAAASSVTSSLGWRKLPPETPESQISSSDIIPNNKRRSPLLFANVRQLYLTKLSQNVSARFAGNRELKIVLMHQTLT